MLSYWRVQVLFYALNWLQQRSKVPNEVLMALRDPTPLCGLVCITTATITGSIGVNKPLATTDELHFGLVDYGDVEKDLESWFRSTLVFASESLN